MRRDPPRESPVSLSPQSLTKEGGAQPSLRGFCVRPLPEAARRGVRPPGRAGAGQLGVRLVSRPWCGTPVCRCISRRMILPPTLYRRIHFGCHLPPKATTFIPLLCPMLWTVFSCHFKDWDRTFPPQNLTGKECFPGQDSRTVWP